MSLKFARLTREAVRKLKPGCSVTEHGITAERRHDRAVRYSVNVMVNGERIHRVIGFDSDGVTRTQAEEYIEKVRTEAREDRLALPKGRKTPLGFSQAAKEYLKRLEEGDGKNIPRKKMHLERHLKPFFKKQPLDRISEFTVARYRKARRREGAAVATINREMATLTQLLRKAVKWKWIRAVPCQIEKPDEGEGRRFTLTDEEADKLLAAAIADQDTYLWLFVVFGLNTAMRHGEILRARFDQITFDTLRLDIPEAKAGARSQPITSELAAILAKERDMRDDRQGWIFPAVRGKLSKAGHRTRMDRPFQRAVKRAGLDPARVTPHVMRHTAITNLVRAGADLPTVQRISGHKTLKMVLRYSHDSDPHTDSVMRAIGRGIPERLGNEKATPATPELHIVSDKSA